MRFGSNGTLATGLVALSERPQILLDLDDNITSIRNISTTVPRQRSNIPEGLLVAQRLLNSSNGYGARPESDEVDKSIVLLTGKWSTKLNRLV